MIYGTLFRAYGPLGRVRAHFYECMARFVFFCRKWTSVWPHGQAPTVCDADILVYLMVERILYE